MRKMAFSWFSILFICISYNISFASPADPSPEGKWDINIQMNGKTLPSWLEIRHSGFHSLIGEFVGIVGSARPISNISFSDNKINFSVPPQWEPGDKDLQFDAVFAGDSLSGTMIYTDGKSYTWTATRAPLLRRKSAPVWKKPITLFNGHNLNGWHALGNNQWLAENGVLKSPKSGANLVTDQKFTDFKLHIEFRYPKESNSGIYLRGRYELQIEDNYGQQPSKDFLGSIYGFIVPSEMAAKPAGEWQSYDVTLIGRQVTVVANGKTIICNQQIPGITGGALDSREGEPGPILIQGDHGPIEYRNIIITTTK
jgi:Domain of Unknown Function (DUF1080).